MICLICRRAEIIEDLTSIKFERGDFRLAVNNVPARICPGCGEIYMDEEIAAQLLQGMKEIHGVGILEEVIDYERLYVK